MLPRTKKRRFGIIEGLEDRQLMAADLVGGIIEPVDSMPKNTGDKSPVFIQAGDKMSDFEAVPNLGQHQLAIPSNLSGVWTNANDNTRGVTKVQVFDGPGGSQIQAWGSCIPEDCDWGSTSMHEVGSSIVDTTPEYAIANQEFGFKSVFITSRYESGDLIVGTYNVFHDDSGRSNYFSEERMWKMGDANHDGHFNSSDIVQIMQAGEYEDGINNNSTWEEGDFDRDGDFTTSDLVLAFSSGGFEQTRVRPFLPPVLIPIPDLDPEVRFNLSADLIDDIFDEDDFEVLQLLPGIEIGTGIQDHIFVEGIIS